MEFNKHEELVGKHSVLSPSKWRWINKDEVAIVSDYISVYATEIGTLLHQYACERIETALAHSKDDFKMNKFEKKDVLLYLLRNGIPREVIDIDYYYNNLMYYVNDAISLKMTPEVPLYFSWKCFGTTDAISFENGELRIHDLKTGKTPAHIEQLCIYAALFCLEYNVKPKDIKHAELRIYQEENVIFYEPTWEEIQQYVDDVIAGNKTLESYISGGVYRG